MKKAIIFVLLGAVLISGCSFLSQLFHIRTDVVFSGNTGAKSLETIDDCSSYLDETYTRIGSPVIFEGGDGVTPSEFKVTIFQAAVSNAEDVYPFFGSFSGEDEGWNNVVDFSAGAVKESLLVPEGTYNQLELFFNLAPNPALDKSSQYYGESRVVFKLPGYTDSNMPKTIQQYYVEKNNIDVNSLHPENTLGNEFNFIVPLTYLGGSVFSVPASCLFPAIVPAAENDFSSFLTIDRPFLPDVIVFNDLIDADGIILSSDPDYIKTEYPLFSSYTNYAIVISSMEPVYIESAGNLEINMDINNLIQVYDNNTPLDTSDDIVVYSQDFWKRISVK